MIAFVQFLKESPPQTFGFEAKVWPDVIFEKYVYLKLITCMSFL